MAKSGFLITWLKFSTKTNLCKHVDTRPSNAKIYFILHETGMELHQMYGGMHAPVPNDVNGLIKYNKCCYIIPGLLAAQWWAYSIGRPLSSVCMYVCMCCQHFQTFSPLKRLGRLKPNFIRSLFGIGEREFVQMVQVTWPRWPPCPYMVKTLKNLLLWNQTADDLETWYAASGPRILPSLFK